MVDFPNNPTDGQTHDENGTQWVYRDPPGGWAVASTGTPVEIVESGLPTANWQVWGDVLIQWGNIVTDANGVGVITYPVAFKTVPSVTATTADAGTPQMSVNMTDFPTTTSVGVVTHNTTNATGEQSYVSWIAIGEAPDALKKPKTVVSAG